MHGGASIEVFAQHSISKKGRTRQLSIPAIFRNGKALHRSGKIWERGFMKVNEASCLLYSSLSRRTCSPRMAPWGQL